MKRVLDRVRVHETTIQCQNKEEQVNKKLQEGKGKEASDKIATNLQFVLASFGVSVVARRKIWSGIFSSKE